MTRPMLSEFWRKRLQRWFCETRPVKSVAKAFVEQGEIRIESSRGMEALISNERAVEAQGNPMRRERSSIERDE